MTSSIRSFLLFYLLLFVAVITSLAFTGTLLLTHHNLNEELDAQLSRTSSLMQAIFSSKLPSNDIKSIQKNLDKIIKKNPANTGNYTNSSNSLPALAFQIWKNKQLILHSPDAPSTPFTTIGKNRLTNRHVGSTSWRISSKYIPASDITIMVANRSDYRQHIENQLTRDSLYIILATITFLGFMIWLIIGKGLQSIGLVTTEVKQRAASYLEPVDMKSIPKEMRPLISELNELFSRLKTAFERHERFTSDAAHELKTPLAALSTHTQIALRTDAADHRNEALLKVLGGVNRCSHVVQQLLTFSRMCPEAGLNNPSEVNITNQAIEVAAMLAPEAIARNVELELINPDCKAIIIGNITAIGILIRNLVDNAIRYSPENSDVKIDISEQSDTVTLRVIDNGPGIPQELRDRVFERFFRVLGNSSPGSGLGLGIVLQIVKLHNASIELLTAPGGQGLEIKIVFPKKCQQT
jgi:two-component system, OmpR family, sensor histidine kinase QseC